MKKNKKIAIIGHFGGKEIFLDGQTVKTKILYEELCKATQWQIRKVDTYYKKSAPLKLMIQTIMAIITVKHIVVLLSGNGMKLYFPLLYWAKKLTGIRIYHDVIGGNLDQYVYKFPNFKKYLNSFEVNWVETNSMKNSLEALGVQNAEVLPNFKRLNCLQKGSLQNTFSEPYRFCTFSRVMKEKGIEEAIQVVAQINKEAERRICELDIYGVVDEDYKERFEMMISQSSDAIQYCGTVPYDKSVDTIKNYYALLFPTFWNGEGFPGTIVDAFSAGLPVIASDWNCNSELVKNKETGIVYPNAEMSNLKDAVEWSLNNYEQFVQMKNACIEEAKFYQPDIHIIRIKGMIDEGDICIKEKQANK